MEYADEVAETRRGDSGKVTFSSTGDDGAEFFEGVNSFKYLGRVLHQEDDDLPVVLHNIRRARQVWRRLGKFLRREGTYLILSESFYRSVVQAVLIFGDETWVL